MKTKKNLKKVKQILKTKSPSNLPPQRFWTAWIKNGKDRAIYVGMAQANNAYIAKLRIIKEWKDQANLVKEIKEGKIQLFVRPMKVIKNGSSK